MVVVDYFVVDKDNVDYGTSNIHLSYLLIVYIKLLSLYVRIVVVVVTQSRDIQADAFSDVPWES